MTARPSVFIATHYILANISEIIKTAGEGNTLVPEVFFRREETRQERTYNNNNLILIMRKLTCEYDQKRREISLLVSIFSHPG